MTLPMLAMMEAHITATTSGDCGLELFEDSDGPPLELLLMGGPELTKRDHDGS